MDQITQRAIFLAGKALKLRAQLGLNPDAQLRRRFRFHARDSAGPRIMSQRTKPLGIIAREARRGSGVVPTASSAVPDRSAR